MTEGSKQNTSTYYDDSLDIEPLVVTRIIEVVKICYNRQRRNRSERNKYD